MPRQKQTVPDLTQTTIVDAYRHGATVKDLAEQLGLTPPVVRRVLADNGVQITPSSQANASRNKRLLAAHSKGATLAELSKRYGISRQRVHVIVTRGY